MQKSSFDHRIDRIGTNLRWPFIVRPFDRHLASSIREVFRALLPCPETFAQVKNKPKETFTYPINNERAPGFKINKT